MKRIFFSIENRCFEEIKQKINSMILTKFITQKTYFGPKIFIKEIGVSNSDLKKIDIERLLSEMYLKIYDYNFIKLQTEEYTSISRDSFNKFFSKCESELVSGIQSEKIENIDERYYKIMNPFTMRMEGSIENCKNSTEKDETDINLKKWKTLNQLTDEEIKEIFGKTKEELKIEDEQRRLNDMKKEEEKEIKKIILKSLYYLQIMYLNLEEFKELIKIYNEYIEKIIKIEKDYNEFSLVRYIIHSICMLEKIYMTNLRLKEEEKKFKVFKILSRKELKSNIDYKLLEEELIKCLLIKSNDGKYCFEVISPSFYLTTPLRMSCLSYVNLITTMDSLIKKEKKLEKTLKDSFTDQKEYPKFLTGAKILTKSSLDKFLKAYSENVEYNMSISTLYSLYFNYMEKTRISQNYSDVENEFYERINLEELTLKEKILKTKILYNFMSDKIEVILTNNEKDFELNSGSNYVIYLKRENIIKNTQNISLSLFENEDKEINYMKKNYISSSRSISENPKFRGNDNYYLVKFLNMKNINNEKFYIFEINVVLENYSADTMKTNTYGTEIITFMLKEDDFEMTGKVAQINYEVLLR
ncbi:hypothetical protein [uncultured Fusobacterium sp.]|uniref:hypothetical protein n=1 Tax=uncultured Fusobacterium sp. TaxID=159267 RepID=UPI0015A6FB97|nr:hypothetical protein [uncultured Fusobacterium sp.]